jgi:choline dehydrogenase-like flavoprotein
MIVTQGRHNAGDLALSSDAVVVGSGAGGAVVARVLAEAGLDVVVLEEGAHVAHAEYAAQAPSLTMRRMGREAFTTAAVPLGDTPVISVLAGRAVGGSSTLTGGICFRIPEIVTDHWSGALGMASLSTSALAPMFDEVERELGVTTVPHEHRSGATHRFVDAAARAGIEFHPLRRNTKDCRGASTCNFGCPYDAKMSVDFNYLPKAVARGARLYSDVRVDRVTTANGRANGVEGVVLDSRGARQGRLTVRAKTVVVSAGTLHTPMILRRSGVGRRSRQLGRNITLHPTFRAAALFPDRVDAWKGAMQSVWSDHFEKDGITLMNAFPPVSILAGAMPGIGAEFMRRARQMGHLATFGGIVHDEGGGRLWRIPGREPLLTYRMAARDRQRFLRGMELIAATFFEAGAREVYLPVYGAPPLRSMDELKAALARRIPSRLIESVTYHPLGSARMGKDPSTAVVGEDGQAHELPGLFVADGSVLPTSLGVNSQLPIMAVATKIAWGLRERPAA